jgi:hypothetical protein
LGACQMSGGFLVIVASMSVNCLGQFVFHVSADFIV